MAAKDSNMGSFTHKIAIKFITTLRYDNSVNPKTGPKTI